MKQTSVYIASPYTTGDIPTNIYRQHEIQDKLISLGFYPYAPLLSTHYQHFYNPHEAKTWKRLMFHWVSKCDCLLCLASGSTEESELREEVEHALLFGKPVFQDIPSLCQHYGPDTNLLKALEKRINPPLRRAQQCQLLEY